MHHLLRRGALAAAAAVTALTAGLLTAPAAHAVSPKATLTADWLTAQLTSGVVYNDEWEYDDYGLTIDVAFALQAVDPADATLAEIDTALQGGVAAYTTYASDIYAGPTAKLAVFAQSIGGDPTTYGGTDLVTQLNRRVSLKPVIKGRLEDKGSADYANVLGQAFAARALKTAGTGRANAAVRFLLKQQCSEGYFRLNFAKSKRWTKQGCDAGNPAAISAPDTDATAVAVLQLQAMPGKTAKTRKAVSKAVRWLKAAQKKNGAFGGGTSTEGANTNSTGLAGWALGVRNACTKARDAARWVAKWQVLDDTAPLAGEVGGVAYDRAGWTAAQSDGITTGTRDQWRRASAQAAPALANLMVADCKAR